MMKKILLFATAILIMVGCGPATDSPTTPMGKIPVANTTVAPNLISPTEIPIPLPTPVPTDSPNSGFKASCLEIVDGEIPLQTVATGTIVLGRGFYGDRSLLNLQTGVEYKVPPASGDVFSYRWAISPDRNLLAISDNLQNADGQFERMILSILNARAEILEKITFNTTGFSNILWLDNQNIILYTAQTPKDGTVMFFNPFAREQRYISNPLPDFYVDSYLTPGLEWLIEYSPDLEWGVYLGYVQDLRAGPIVYDFVAKQVLWMPSLAGSDYDRPLWSPNGDKVAVVVGRQLYIVDRSGHAKPVLNESQQKEVQQPSWSPDGRYIIFWNVHDSLMLYDSQSEAVYDLCYKGDHLLPLIWSPDSRQIAIPAYAGESSNLIDIEESKVYKLTAIPGFIYPMEWINSIP